MNWVTTETGHRCRAHGVSFDRGEVCGQCIEDPGPAPTSESDIDQTSLSQRIAECATKAASLWSLYETHRDGDDPGIAIKAAAEHTKLFRLALEFADRRESREHDLVLLRHEREMSGVRSSH